MPALSKLWLDKFLNYLNASVVGMPSVYEQVTIDATAGGNKNTTAFEIGRLYSFTPNVDCYMNFGDASVAATINQNFFCPAGQEKIFVARYEYVAVIRDTVDGVLFIAKLDGMGDD